MFTWIFLPPEQDAYISQFYDKKNFGCVPYLYANLYQCSCDEYQSLVQFNFCGVPCNQIPPDSMIKEARLILTIYRNEIPETTRLFAYRVLERWDECKVTWDTRPLFDPDPVGYVDIDCNDTGTVTMELDESVIKKWYNGFYENNGLLLLCEEPVNSLIGFYSREFENSDFWPRLAVSYRQNCCPDDDHRPPHFCSDDDRHPHHP